MYTSAVSDCLLATLFPRAVFPEGQEGVLILSPLVSPSVSQNTGKEASKIVEPVSHLVTSCCIFQFICSNGIHESAVYKILTLPLSHLPPPLPPVSLPSCPQTYYPHPYPHSLTHPYPHFPSMFQFYLKLWRHTLDLVYNLSLDKNCLLKKIGLKQKLLVRIALK